MSASRDDNFVTTLLAVSSVDGVTPVTLYANPTTHRLLVDLAGGGSGTVQTVAIATANGFAGTSDGNASAPTLTLTTSVTGVLYGNGTAMSALTIGSGLSLVGTTLSATGGGTGTVTDVSVVTANGVSGSVATSTTTPAITLTLGAITPTSVSATSFVAATPATDTMAGVFRRNNSGQTSNILEIQTEANAVLAGFDKVGKITVPSANVSGLTASEIVITDASKNLTSAAVATYPSLTELSYVKGLTSAIQTQINSKVADTGDTMTGALAIDVAGTPLTITNTTDAQSNTGLIIQSDRVTPATDDEIYLKFRLSDSAGNQDSFGEILVVANDVTSTSEDGAIYFRYPIAGTLANRVIFTGATIYPATNDAIALGTTSRQFSDLFLAEGGVINFDNGDVTVTQTGNVLAVAGGDLRVATADVGTNADSVPTISSTNTFTNKRITRRTGTTTSSATPTINTDNVDEYYITAQTEAITSFTTNLSGTPTLGQGLFISVIGTAARAITWGASFANGPVALPTTTVTTTQLSTFFKWDGSVWRCYATGSTV